jgi:hypothetical protein
MPAGRIPQYTLSSCQFLQVILTDLTLHHPPPDRSNDIGCIFIDAIPIDRVKREQALPSHLKQSGVIHGSQMMGNARLRHAQHLYDLANATFALK